MSSPCFLSPTFPTSPFNISLCFLFYSASCLLHFKLAILYFSSHSLPALLSFCLHLSLFCTFSSQEMRFWLIGLFPPVPILTFACLTHTPSHTLSRTVIHTLLSSFPTHTLYSQTTHTLKTLNSLTLSCV